MWLQISLEKRFVTAAGLQQIVQEIQTAGKQGLGQRLVAHAWADPAFKARLLKDGGAAAAELGISADGVSSKDGITGNTHSLIECVFQGWRHSSHSLTRSLARSLAQIVCLPRTASQITHSLTHSLTQMVCLPRTASQVADIHSLTHSLISSYK